VVSMCRVLRVHRSGYYSWIKEPLSARSKEDIRLLESIRIAYEESGGIYGSPRIYKDLRESGERCGEKRVARIMRQHKIKAERSYKKPRFRSGKPAKVFANRLREGVKVWERDQAWVTDITYIRTYEGWLYLAVVMDLHSRMIIGWSMKSTLSRELVLDALLMAVWRRRPGKEVIVHSDQGSQYGSYDWMRFCRDHKLQPSMSRRGNCYDNAVVESFFSSLKKELIKRRIYKTREEGRSDVFDYIEVFNNRSRRHSSLGQISPYEFERASCGSK
jgi:putative transposase